MDEQQHAPQALAFDSDDHGSPVSAFADSYATFTRVVNSLQRQYINLKDELADQQNLLVQANQKLLQVTQENLSATVFLNSILGSISAGVIAVDMDGRVTHFNPAASLMLGLPIREPLGKHYRDAIPPGIPVSATALRAAETGRAVDAVERQIELSDGTRLILSVSTAILRDSDGQTLGAVEVFHDLSKIKKLEMELARLNTLAALGEMAATIAHEVRNPLAAIGGFAALVQRDTPETDPRHKLLEKIIAGVENLNRTVTTLLNYSRHDEMNREAVSWQTYLSELVDRFMYDHAEAINSVEIEFTTSESEQLGHLTIDPLLLSQALVNLLRNAVEACGETGTVTVSSRRLTHNEALHKYSERVMLGLDETILATSVEDTGAGIPTEHLDKIFSPFYTTKTNGTGLGLAVAWKIVKAHGGDLFAENVPGGGARFVIVLPVKTEPARMELQQ